MSDFISHYIRYHLFLNNYQRHFKRNSKAPEACFIKCTIRPDLCQYSLIAPQIEKCYNVSITVQGFRIAEPLRTLFKRQRRTCYAFR